jgi:hypothetical protein
MPAREAVRRPGQRRHRRRQAATPAIIIRLGSACWATLERRRGVFLLGRNQIILSDAENSPCDAIVIGRETANVETRS